MRNVYTTKEVAKLFGVSPFTVRDWVLEGRFHDAAKVGNNWLYPKNTVNEMVAARMERRRHKAKLKQQKAERQQRLASAAKKQPVAAKQLDEKLQGNLLILNVASDYPSRVRAAREILSRLSEIL